MNNLQAGIEAYKKGEREKAREYFLNALNENPRDETAWAWLYQASDYLDDRIIYLKKILEINPANEHARQELIKITPKKLVPPKAQEPKAESPKPNTQTKNIIIGMGAILALCFICICAFAFYNPPKGPPDYKTMAYIQCQLQVKDRLKSPTTADFPASSLTDIRDGGNKVFEVRSYVDSQNSFSAMIRTNFFCKIQYTGSEQDDEGDPRFWDLLQLDFIE